jgi:hypothetical protein
MDGWISELSSVVTAATAAGACFLSLRNYVKLNSIHVQINSRMDQLLMATHQAGVTEERDREANERE